MRRLHHAAPDVQRRRRRCGRPRTTRRPNTAPTMSTIESSAPTSWRWTCSTGIWWMRRLRPRPAAGTARWPGRARSAPSDDRLDQRDDLRQRTVAVVRVRMARGRCSCVRAVALRLDEPELRGRHAGPQHAVRRESVARDHQAAERRLEFGQRQTGVEQRAEHHVARGAGEAIEVEDLGHGYRYPDSFRLQ